jgi:hypothetical protein
MSYGLAARATVSTLVVGTALVACELEPGKASLKFDGTLMGQVDGPTVTCQPTADTSAIWTWEGTVGGHSASVTAAALNSSGVPDALLVQSENRFWMAEGQAQGAALSPGKFSVRVGSKKVLYIDGIASTKSNETQVEIHGVMRCPN